MALVNDNFPILNIIKKEELVHKWWNNFKRHYEWTERKPRMWTTVFTEEEEKNDTDMQKHGKAADYMKATDSHHEIFAVIDGYFLLLLVVS